MFFVVWLPLTVALIVFIGYIITAIQDSDIETAIGGFFKSLMLGVLVTAFSFALVSLLFWTEAPAHAYSDLDHPQYLAKIPGYATPKYLISTESLATGERFTYYVIDQSGQPMETDYSASSIRIIEDNPTRPFVAKIKYTCDGDRFWVLYCLNPSPYSYELHVPANSTISISP